MDGRSNVGIKKAEKVLCMVLAMLMAIVITINVSAGESISKAKIDEISVYNCVQYSRNRLRSRYMAQ